MDLIQQPRDAQNWRGPYLQSDSIPKDPWGNDYIYECPGRHNPTSYDISSLGPPGDNIGDRQLDHQTLNEAPHRTTRQRESSAVRAPGAARLHADRVDPGDGPPDGGDLAYGAKALPVLPRPDAGLGGAPVAGADTERPEPGGVGGGADGFVGGCRAGDLRLGSGAQLRHQRPQSGGLRARRRPAT